MSQPNREDARDALCTLLSSIAGDGAQVFKAILNAAPASVDGRSPLLLVFSAGSKRRPMAIGTSQLDNQFRIELNVLVAEDTSAVDDTLDDCEQALAEVIGNTDNRVTANWAFLDWEDTFSDVRPATFGRFKYLMESFNVIVTVWGA